MKKRLIATLLISALVFALLPATAFAQTTVSTFAELEAALNGSDNTIVVTAEIVLPDGTDLDGNGKTVCVAVPAIDENGRLLPVQTTSNHGVFRINSGSAVTLENMTVMGGSSGTTASNSIKPAIDTAGTLTMTNVTVTRSNRGIENRDNGRLILKNCCITRNAAAAGGGILNYPNAIAVLDGCSLSENRSLSDRGGGGAAQNNGTMYINNTVIANNSSTEIGGAINNYGTGDRVGALYIMNSTVCGNVTTSGYGINSGGGIGVNNGNLYAVNSIFADNKYINGSAVSSSDIGIFNGTSSLPKSANLNNCLYGAITCSDANFYDVADCITDTANAFAGYRNDGLLWQASGTTAGFSHPQLVIAPGTKAMYYAPLTSSAHNVRTGGVHATYFDYTDVNAVKMSYVAAAGGSETPLGALSPGGTQVTKTIVAGETRSPGIMGASGSTTEKLYTVKRGTNIQNGDFTGVSEYGDSYPYNTLITVTATPNANYVFKEWTVAPTDGGTATTFNSNPYSFRVTNDVTLTPVFTSSVTTVTVTFDTQGRGSTPPAQTIIQGSVLSAPLAPTAADRVFGGWYKETGCTTPWDFSSPVTETMTLYAKWTAPISISPLNTFVQGNAPGNLTINIDGALSTGDFGSLEIGPGGTNFETVDSGNYSVTYNSIHIALSQSWLNTLAPGVYTLRVNLAGTYAGTSLTTQLIVTAPGGAGDVGPDIPKTGDGAQPLLWAGLMLLAGAGLGVRRRRGKA